MFNGLVSFYNKLRDRFFCPCLEKELMLYNLNNVAFKKKDIQTWELLFFCLAVKTVSCGSLVFRDSSKTFLNPFLTFQYQLKITTVFLNNCSKYCVDCGIVLLFKSLEIPYPEIEWMWARSQLLPCFNGGFIQVSGKSKKKKTKKKPRKKIKKKKKKKIYTFISKSVLIC